jgi:hypothetical protein
MNFACKTVLAAASVLFTAGAFAQTTPQGDKDNPSIQQSATKQPAQSLSHSAPPATGMKQPAQSLSHADPDADGSLDNLQKKH